MELTHLEVRQKNTPSNNEFYTRMYLRYVNEFLTLDRFAEYYGISVSRASNIVKVGKALNDKHTIS